MLKLLHAMVQCTLNLSPAWKRAQKHVSQRTLAAAWGYVLVFTGCWRLAIMAAMSIMSSCISGH